MNAFDVQTVHQPTQLFYEDEVFKTGHMVDHPVEDIIERIGCQFYTKVSLRLACNLEPRLILSLQVYSRTTSQRRMVSRLAAL
jgi:hypothetical protein